MWWAITNSPGIFFMDSLLGRPSQMSCCPLEYVYPPRVEYHVIIFIVARYSGVYI